jgi:hypothetical protein
MWYDKGLGLLKDKLQYEFLNSSVETVSSESELVLLKKLSCKKAFILSTALSVPLGGVGWLTWIGDAVALVRLQLTLLKSIAQYRGVGEEDVGRLLFWCFAAEVGLDSNKLGLKYEEKVTIKGAMFKQLSEKLTLYLFRRSLGRVAGWLLAPLMGYFSYSMTKRLWIRFEAMLAELKKEEYRIPKIPVTKVP